MRRAVSRSGRTWRKSPARGTSAYPKISTGADGPAAGIVRPRSSLMARTLPNVVPERKVSPGRSVPFWTMTVAIGPFRGSSRASRTTPWAGAEGLAFKSRTSAIRRIISRSSGMFFRSLAEISTLMTSPPHSSTSNPSFCSSRLIRSGLASGLSILLMATSRGTPAALA